MGLFGGDSSSSKEIITTTINDIDTTTTTSVGDIGLTGKDAIELANILKSTSAESLGTSAELQNNIVQAQGTSFNQLVGGASNLVSSGAGIVKTGAITNIEQGKIFGGTLTTLTDTVLSSFNKVVDFGKDVIGTGGLQIESGERIARQQLETTRDIASPIAAQEATLRSRSEGLDRNILIVMAVGAALILFIPRKIGG